MTSAGARAYKWGLGAPAGSRTHRNFGLDFAIKQHKSLQTTAKDVLPNTHRTQATASVQSRHHVSPSPPAAMEWSRLLLVDVICSVRRRRPWWRLTMHCQRAGRPLSWPSPLTLIFKLVRARDQTRLPCEFGTNPFSDSKDIWQAVEIGRKMPFLSLVTLTFAF